MKRKGPQTKELKAALQDKPLFVEILQDARQAISIRYSQLALVSLSMISQVHDTSPRASGMAAVEAHVSRGPCAMRSC